MDGCDKIRAFLLGIYDAVTLTRFEAEDVISAMDDNQREHINDSDLESLQGRLRSLRLEIDDIDSEVRDIQESQRQLPQPQKKRA